MDTKPTGKILVVEDQSNWYELLIEVLETDGHTVKHAKSFQEAKGLLEAEAFDLATIDMRLIDAFIYNVDGMAVLQEVKTKLPSMKAIVITGYADPEQKAKALEYYHADHYLEKAPEGKSFDIDEFSRLIFDLLQK